MLTTHDFDSLKALLLNGDSLEVVQKFCYLGDMLDAASSITRVQCIWGKFRNLHPCIKSEVVLSKVKGELFKACIQTVMSYGSETWPSKVEERQREYTEMRWWSSAGYVVPLHCAETLSTYSERGLESLQSVSWCMQDCIGSAILLEWKKNNGLRKVQNLEIPGDPKCWSEVINDD